MKRSNDEPADKARERLKQMEDARKPVPDQQEGNSKTTDPDTAKSDSEEEKTNQNSPKKKQ